LEPTETQVTDNRELGRFEIRAEGVVAYLEYTRGPSVIVLVHTEVPERLGGRGVAGRLARHAVELARRELLRVDLVCPFMLGWIDRHPEHADLLHGGSGAALDDPFWF